MTQLDNLAMDLAKYADPSERENLLRDLSDKLKSAHAGIDRLTDILAQLKGEANNQPKRTFNA